MRRDNLKPIIRELIFELNNLYVDNKNNVILPLWIRHYDLVTQISDRKVYELRKKGILKFSRIGAMYFYKYTDLVALVSSNVINLDLGELRDKHLFKDIDICICSKKSQEEKSKDSTLQI